MKIYVKQPGECNIRISVPNWLVLNRVGVSIVCKIINKESKKKRKNINLTKKELHAFIRQIRRAKKSFRDWYLVDVSSSDGTTVKIKL